VSIVALKILSPAQGLDDLLERFTQGSADFVSLALGYNLAGFQPLKMDRREQ